jgi:hypothetical protein
MVLSNIEFFYLILLFLGLNDFSFTKVSRVSKNEPNKKMEPNCKKF